MAIIEFRRPASAPRIPAANRSTMGGSTVFELLARLRKDVSNVCAQVEQLRRGLVPHGVTAIFPLSDLNAQLGEAERDLRSGLAYLVPDEDHLDQALPGAQS